MDDVTRRVLALVVAGAALLALGLIRVGGGGPPLYEGVCPPLTYARLGASPAPLSASSAVVAGVAAIAATGETTPQAQIILPGKNFPLPAGTKVTLTITPTAPPSVPPPDGTIDGNVYTFAAVGPGGSRVDLSPDSPATIVLGATTSGGAQPTMERFDGKRWTRLTTVDSGCATQEANTTTLAQFALVTLGSQGGAAPTPGSDGAPVAAVIAAAAAVAGLLVVILLVRRRRTSALAVSSPRRPSQRPRGAASRRGRGSRR